MTKNKNSKLELILQSMPQKHSLSGRIFARGRNGRPELYAVRMGKYKAHYITEGAYGMFGDKKVHIPLLYDINQDPSENYNIAEKHPGVIAKINELVHRHRSNLVIGKDLLAERE